MSYPPIDGKLKCNKVTLKIGSVILTVLEGSSTTIPRACLYILCSGTSLKCHLRQKPSGLQGHWLTVKNVVNWLDPHSVILGDPTMALREIYIWPLLKVWRYISARFPPKSEQVLTLYPCRVSTKNVNKVGWRSVTFPLTWRYHFPGM